MNKQVNWKMMLKADPTDWLLEEDNPSVRYFTLTDILGLREQHPDVQRAKRMIMEHGIVPAILARQQNDGGWVQKANFYHFKYRGSVWTLIILAELGADPKHPKVRKVCEYIFENSWSRLRGGFASRIAKPGKSNDSDVITCLTANMTYSLIRLGWLHNQRVQRSIDWLTTWMRYDDGDSQPPLSHPYRHRIGCFGKHTCFHFIISGLKALAEVPVKIRSTKVRFCIARGTEFMLMHRIYHSSHDLRKIGHPGWTSFGFPLMHDALEVLRVLTKLGYHDPRMQKAIDLVINKQNKKGHWLLEHTYNGRMQVGIETKGKPSKWITLNALRVLKHYYSDGLKMSV